MHYSTLFLPLAAAAVVASSPAEDPRSSNTVVLPASQVVEDAQPSNVADGDKTIKDHVVAGIAGAGGLTEQDKQCNQLAGYKKIMDLSQNESMLKEFATDTLLASSIKAQATSASSAYSSLMSDTKLVSKCAELKAQATEVTKCMEIAGLQRIVSLANDEEALKKSLTASDKIEGYKSQATEAASRLSSLTADKDLVSHCSSMSSRKLP